MRGTRTMLGSIAAVCLCSAAYGQAAPGDRSAQVAEHYARTYGTTAAEASARLGRLQEISRVEKQLAEKFPNQFGGLYVVHKPAFRVVVRMTGNGQGLLRQITDDPIFVVEQAETPVMQLRQLKDRVAKRLMTETKFYFAVAVNVRDGTVEIRSTDVDAVRKLLATDLQNNKNIRLIAASAPGPNTTTIYGGQQGTGTVQYCTTGFNVTADFGPGIITAGHCDNTMTVSGVTFNVVSEAYKDSDMWGFDVQLMRPSSTQTYPNQTYVDSAQLETITQAYYAGDIPYGWSLCAFGRSTNVMRCGTLTAKWEVKRDNNGITGSFFRATPDDGQPFVIGGDSGGPVFGSGTAYGIIKGRGDSVYPNDMYFMDIETLEAYGGLDYNPRVKIAP